MYIYIFINLLYLSLSITVTRPSFVVKLLIFLIETSFFLQTISRSRLSSSSPFSQPRDIEINNSWSIPLPLNGFAVRNKVLFKIQVQSNWLNDRDRRRTRYRTILNFVKTRTTLHRTRSTYSQSAVNAAWHTFTFADSSILNRTDSAIALIFIGRERYVF